MGVWRSLAGSAYSACVLKRRFSVRLSAGNSSVSYNDEDIRNVLRTLHLHLLHNNTNTQALVEGMKHLLYSIQLKNKQNFISIMPVLWSLAHWPAGSLLYFVCTLWCWSDLPTPVARIAWIVCLVGGGGGGGVMGRYISQFFILCGFSGQDLNFYSYALPKGFPSNQSTGLFMALKN